MKKIIYSCLILGTVLLFSQKVQAAIVAITPVPSSVDQQQQFYVDVTVDAQGASFNGIQGTITFSSNTLSFVREETGSSNITYFIDQPVVHGNTIAFSGIIPGGFDGLIDPFDPTHKRPGEIIRLVFAGKAAGMASVAISNVHITANDGSGTLEAVPDTNVSFPVTTSVSPSVYNSTDTTPPTLTTSVITDKELYNGKYVLLFTATDKQSGVNHVELQEGDGVWNVIQSPYLLRDQSRKSILLVRAIDNAGNATVITINAAQPSVSLWLIALLLIAVIIILYVIKRTQKA